MKQGSMVGIRLGIVMGGLLIFLIMESSHCDKQCGGAFYAKSKNNLSFTKVYTCPLVGGNEESIDCCDPPSFRCCQPASSLLAVDSRTAVIITVLAIFAFLVSSAAIYLCCFSEKCPLFLLCRREAKMDYIATREEAEVLHMPGEICSKVKMYNPTTAIVSSVA